MQEHIWGLKESRKKNIRHLVRLEVRVFRVQQVTLWSHQHSGILADTVCAAGLGCKDWAASGCLQLPVVRPTKQCFLLVQTCCYCPNVLAFPRQWPLVFLIHVFLSSDSHPALSVTRQTFVWCLLYARHVTSTLVVILNKTKAQTLEPVSCLPVPAFSHNVCGLLLPAGRTSSSLA